MPELPEVETICGRIGPEAAGRRIERVRLLRASTAAPQEAGALARAEGRKIERVWRRGKNLLMDLSGGLAFRIHLRMTGGVRVVGNGFEPSAATRVLFELSGGRTLAFDDPRALGTVHLLEAGELEELLRKLGPEPLSDDFAAGGFVTAAALSRMPAKLFLMDQRHVAGLGNIYAAEALFRAGIHPGRAMRRVSRSRLEKLHCAIVSTLREALESARIAYTSPGGFHGAEAFRRWVYAREGEPCFACGRAIRRVPQGGRSTYYCPGCQR